MKLMTNIALLPVTGDLDVTSVGRLRSEIDRLIESGCKRIVLNMGGCGYIDSAGMALLLSEIRHMRAAHGLLSLINVSDRMMRAFRIWRLVDVAPVSGVGTRAEVVELDPSVQSLWRTSYKVNAANMSQTRHYVEDQLARTKLTEDQGFDFNLAVGEAIGNAVDHADGDCAVVTLTGYPDRVIAEVADRGCGFDPSCVEAPTDGGADDACCGAPAERGRGIKLMRLLADSVDIRPRDGGGTLVRIVKLYE